MVIKFIDVDQNTYQIEDFQNELKVLHDLNKFKFSGFSKLIDIGVTNNRDIQYLFKNSVHFIIMEKLGISISEIFKINHKYLRQIDILKLGIQLIKNVQRLHQIGYVHLDLKPDNFMLDVTKK